MSFDLDNYETQLRCLKSDIDLCSDLANQINKILFGCTVCGHKGLDIT